MKSKRTNRKPIAPATAEFCGTAFEGLESLALISLKCTLIKLDLINYRNGDYDLYAPVTNGLATLVHDRLPTININGLWAFNGEPDLVHLIAALTEYAIWIEYWDTQGYSMVDAVDSGSFFFQDRNGSIISGSPVAHDLWIDDELEDSGSVVNMISLPPGS